jgi:hypothetical protein
MNELGQDEDSKPAEAPKQAGQKSGETKEGPGQITDIAATAMSIQPTGYTLETTKVRRMLCF